MISYDDFVKVDIRVGRIISIDDFPEARKPAYKLNIDFGPEIGTKRSSVQATEHYSKEDLLNKSVLCVVNFPSKQIGPFQSEVLTLGVPDENGKVILVSPLEMPRWAESCFKMNYRGIIIEESLANKSVLDDVNIVKTDVETVTKDHKTPWLKQWTMHTVEVPEEKADEIVKKISEALDVGWYADYKNDDYHYIVFGNKIFKVDRKKPSLYKEVKEYGVSQGIPDYQLDFAPDDKVWEREKN